MRNRITRKRTNLAIAIALLGGSALLGSAAVSIADAPATQPAAQQAAWTATPSSGDQSGVDLITLSQNLAAWGRTNHNPAALEMAAQVMASVPTQPLANARKDSEGSADTLATSEHHVTYQMTPVALHAEALAMAGSNVKAKAAIAAIDNASTSTSRGAVEGIIRHEDQVNASSVDTYHIAFKGGELADIAIIGDGHTALDLGIFDANNNLVAQDCNGRDRDHVSFTPTATQTYTIKIRNNGAAPNAYTMYTN